MIQFFSRAAWARCRSSAWMLLFGGSGGSFWLLAGGLLPTLCVSRKIAQVLIRAHTSISWNGTCLRVHSYEYVSVRAGCGRSSRRSGAGHARSRRAAASSGARVHLLHQVLDRFLELGASVALDRGAIARLLSCRLRGRRTSSLRLRRASLRSRRRRLVSSVPVLAAVSRPSRRRF